MKVDVYGCETATVRSETIKRVRDEGTFYGLRLHMNTDQAITFWSTSVEGLNHLVDELKHVVETKTPNEARALPGQFAQ